MNENIEVLLGKLGNYRNFAAEIITVMENPELPRAREFVGIQMPAYLVAAAPALFHVLRLILLAVDVGLGLDSDEWVAPLTGLPQEVVRPQQVITPDIFAQHRTPQIQTPQPQVEVGITPPIFRPEAQRPVVRFEPIAQHDPRQAPPIQEDVQLFHSLLVDAARELPLFTWEQQALGTVREVLKLSDGLHLNEDVLKQFVSAKNRKVDNLLVQLKKEAFTSVQLAVGLFESVRQGMPTAQALCLQGLKAAELVKRVEQARKVVNCDILPGSQGDERQEDNARRQRELLQQEMNQARQVRAAAAAVRQSQQPRFFRPDNQNWNQGPRQDRGWSGRSQPNRPGPWRGRPPQQLGYFPALRDTQTNQSKQ